MPIRQLSVRFAGTLLALLLSCAPAWSVTRKEASERMPLADETLVLDIAQAGDRIVAVGERGHILLSDDFGRSWRQVIAPTRATLNSVHFPSPQRGWAVGHHNTILFSDDAGETWQHQPHGGDVRDVFLDVLFLNDETGFAVGAYGIAYTTRNAGATWKPIEPIPDQLHYNRISVGPDGSLFIAVEMGLLLASGDNGESWQELPSPYEGSFFGIFPLNARTLIAYGLRGHVFRSFDRGQSWQAIDTPTDVLLFDAVRLHTGPIVIAGMSGQLLLSRDGGQNFERWPQDGLQGTTALLPTPDGALLTAGMNGLVRLPFPEFLNSSR